ncbi:fungal-specific transcription factor domain-containing protein [Bisporella sp. PMI_857]|nr:fungal-specific transcription factor domain-containing protein [Bisporella sp. PMI_857]
MLAFSKGKHLNRIHDINIGQNTQMERPADSEPLLSHWNDEDEFRSETSQHQGPPRVVQACVRCKERKRRCDGNTPTCESCLGRGENCIYRGVRKRRGPGRNKQHIQALEKRLLDMEALLHQSDVPQQSGTSKASREPPSTADCSSTLHPTTSIDVLHVREETLNETRHPTYSYISRQGSGPDEGESVHSRHLTLTSHANVPLHFEGMRKLDERINHYKSAEHPMALGVVVTAPLLPEEADKFLLEQSIRDVFDELPLFHIPWFLERLSQPRCLEQLDDRSWWACLNASIAMAVQLRTINKSFRAVSLFSWAFFKNAYAVFPELVIQGHDLVAVQSFLVMAMFMKASADTRTTTLFLSTALRTSQVLGLNIKRNQTSNCNNQVTEKARNRVFWVAYILDMEISTNCGLPSLQADEDVDIDLLINELQHGYEGFDFTGDGANIFGLRAQLTTIQAKVRKRLYTAKSLCQPAGQLLRTVQELDFALQDWRSRIPADIQPGKKIQSRDLALAHFTYFNCVSMVHWSVLRRDSGNVQLGTSVSVLEIPHFQVVTSISRVRAAARATIGLLQSLPLQTFAELWRILPYPVSASLTLLSTALNDPAIPEARLDLVALGWFVRFIGRMVNEEGCDLTHMLKGCLAIEKAVSAAVANRTEDWSQTVLLDDNANALSSLLSTATHPMYVAQGLMGNLPNLDAEIAHALAGILGTPWEESCSYGPFVPECLRPGSFGFMFDSKN